ncbi:MAG: hypothetical protein K6T86_10195 [Pirellulales bacterium]|nr:hypothetical protein [Pirellulales bacterium]
MQQAVGVASAPQSFDRLADAFPDADADTVSAVLEAAVVASPDAVRGSVVKAYVVLRAGHSASDALAAELQQWVKTHRAPYKYPRKIEFVRELPKTPSGKIKRRVLRQRELSSETSRGEERDKVSDE